MLLKMRSTGKLLLPGGGSEVDERLEEALRREVREETGLEIELTDIQSMARLSSPRCNKKTCQMTHLAGRSLGPLRAGSYRSE